MIRLTVTRVLSWGPCDRYTDDDAALLHRLLPEEGLTPLEVCDLTEVPVPDRLWALLREEILPARELRLLACRWAEGALLRERADGREPDPRSWAAIEVARRYSRGEATVGDLDAARAAAEAADWAAARDSALDAAMAAARAAAEAAAWAAAMAAALAASWAASWAAQLADVRAEIVRIDGEEVCGE